MRRFSVSLLVGVALLAVPAAASAASADMWATVNVCDTAGSPNAMGVRASMPGNGSGQRMYMRFNATYYSVSRQAWFSVEGQGRSQWTYVGKADVRARQSGYTFQFSAPRTPGTTFVVRGVVEMQWRKPAAKRSKRGRKRARKSKTVVRRVKATTRQGIQNLGVGDPPGTSEGLCVIS